MDTPTTAPISIPCFGHGPWSRIRRRRCPSSRPSAALNAVLALDRPGMLDDALALHEFEPNQSLAVGPFTVRTRLLPHWVPNAGMRLARPATR